MRRVSAGEELIIPAPTWNQLVSGLETGKGAGPGIAKGFRPSLTCLVQNNTGVDLPRFGVVGFDDPIILPADNETEFLTRVAFSGVLAAGTDFDLKWGLTLAPIIAGQIGEVVVQGLCYAKLTAVSTTAGPKSDGDVNALVPADCGLARVLWRQTGSGSQWAIVCLG